MLNSIVINQCVHYIDC